MWLYSIDYVDLFLNETPSVTLVDTGSSAFETISFTGEEWHNVTYDDTYAQLHYYLILKRRPEYYIFVLFIPSFLLTSLSIIGLFTPNSSDGEREERMTLGLTTLLSMAVILNITADAMPKSAKGLPLLGYYIFKEIAVCALSTVLSTVIIFMHERANTENWDPPRAIRWIASIKTPCEYVKRTIISGKQTKISDNVISTSNSNEAQLIKDNNKHLNKEKDNGLNFPLNSPIEGREMLAYLQKILATIDGYLESLNECEEKNGVWKRALDKIDLFLLVVIFIANCILTLSVVF